MWLSDFVDYAAARNCVGRTSLMIGRLGRMLAEPGPTDPQALLDRTCQHGPSAAALARTLEGFFVDAGLAFPLTTTPNGGPAGGGDGSMRPPNRFGLHLAASPTPR